MQEFITNSEAETQALGAYFAGLAKENDFFALFGEMGCGKTVFVRGFCEKLVPEARVSSPTYTVLNDYEGKTLTVHHFDCYRITSEDDLISTDYDEIIKSGITCCEWPENIIDFLPSSYWKLSFSRLSEDKRRIIAERIEP